MTMAKICKPIVEYKEIILSNGLTIDKYSPTKKTMQRFIRIFKKISDTRVEQMIDYPLYEILLIAFMTILANGSGWSDMEQFGQEKEKWLKKFLPLKNGIPSHDTFQRVFSLIDAQELQNATVQFIVENIGALKKSLGIKDENRQICIDGKEECSTGRKYGTDEKIRNMQMLHVYDASNEICLFSKAIDEKTNEIPVAQEIIKILNLKDAVVTFDALHTQTKTIGLIVKQGGNYVGALKENQCNLATDAAECFSDAVKKKIRENENNYYKTLEKAHSQVETREYYLAKAQLCLSDKDNWKKLKSFICYEKNIYNTITGEETKEIRYYISSLTDIVLCADSIRGHWQIENKLHWHLDVNFFEDDNTTMNRNAFTNLSILNKMALSLSKLAQPLMGKSSLRAVRKRFAWSFESNLGLILSAFDEDAIKQALLSAQNKKR